MCTDLLKIKKLSYKINLYSEYKKTPKINSKRKRDDVEDSKCSKKQNMSLNDDDDDECSICCYKHLESHFLTCTHCEKKWCKTCIKKTDMISYHIQKKIIEKQYIGLEDIKKIINSWACPFCKKYKTFIEETDYKFKADFINLILRYSNNFKNYRYNKKYKCDNCSNITETKSIIPQCNECKLFNMNEIE
mgnify:CR=1 FL=1|tara:strand:- start:620 stop:1189 length:570 start_codon:yes stop_codon:yes gene_type:complete